MNQWLNDSIFLPRSFDDETLVAGMDGLLGLFDVAHMCAARPLCELALEFFERRLVADGVSLHAPIPQIFHVASQTKLVANTLGKKTIAYSLHGPGDHEFLGDSHVRFSHGHWGANEQPQGLHPSITDLARPLPQIAPREIIAERRGREQLSGTWS